MGIRGFAALLILLFLCGSSQAEVREWTDTTGKFKVSAELIGVEAGKAMLRKTDGKVLPVPLEKLSSADAALAKAWKPADNTNKTPANSQPQLKATTEWMPHSSFDAAGKQTDSLRLICNVQVLGTSAAEAISCGQLKLTAAEDEKHRPLQMHEEEIMFADLTKEFVRIDREENAFKTQPKNGFLFEIIFDEPKEQLTKLSKLSGSIRFRRGEAPSTIHLAKIRGILDKPVENAELKKAGMQVMLQIEKNKFEGEKSESLVANLSGKTNLFGGARLIDAKGKPLPNVMSNVNAFQDNVSVIFHTQNTFPDELQLEMVAFDKIIEEEVPFDLGPITVAKKPKPGAVPGGLLPFGS